MLNLKKKFLTVAVAAAFSVVGAMSAANAATWSISQFTNQTTQFLPNNSSYTDVYQQSFDPLSDPSVVSVNGGYLLHPVANSYNIYYAPSQANQAQWDAAMGDARLMGYTGGYNQNAIVAIINQYRKTIGTASSNGYFPELNYAQMATLTQAYNQGRAAYLAYNGK